MQARLEGKSTKDGSASACKPSCDDPPFATEAKQEEAKHEGKQLKQSRTVGFLLRGADAFWTGHFARVGQ